MAPVADFKQFKPRLIMSGPRSSIVKSTNGRADGLLFDPMEDALDAFARGEFLVVMDDEGRENEGDLIIAASQCTTEKMAWMIKHTRCVLPHQISSLLHLNVDNPKRLYLYLASKREVGGTGNPDDGGPKRGSQPNRLHRHG